MLLAFGAEPILELQVTLTDVVTSTAGISKGDLGDKILRDKESHV